VAKSAMTMKNALEYNHIDSMGKCYRSNIDLDSKTYISGEIQENILMKNQLE
jgi:hypothetical protein